MGTLSLIVLLPLAGFLLNGLLATRLSGHPFGKRFVTVVGCGLPILAFLLALRAWRSSSAGGYVPLQEVVFTWATIGDEPFEIAFRFDRLTAVMVLIVTGVGSLIHVYSTGYMHDDESYARYFAYLNLFLFFMLLLVLGRSLLVLFVGWEGVGLASYLLIGFWFEDPEKAAAGKKAFIVNRIGDAGFLLGHVPALHGGRHAGHGPDQRRLPRHRPRRRSRRRWSACCSSSARRASRRRSRCTCGCPTRWPARRRCRR